MFSVLESELLQDILRAVNFFGEKKNVADVKTDRALVVRQELPVA